MVRRPKNVTLSELAERRLDELCQRYKISASRLISGAIARMAAEDGKLFLEGKTEILTLAGKAHHDGVQGLDASYLSRLVPYVGPDVEPADYEEREREWLESGGYEHDAERDTWSRK